MDTSTMIECKAARMRFLINLVCDLLISLECDNHSEIELNFSSSFTNFIKNLTKPT